MHFAFLPLYISSIYLTLAFLRQEDAPVAAVKVSVSIINDYRYQITRGVLPWGRLEALGCDLNIEYVLRYFY
jgi:hypothetical protein